jgi:hypothetical protein
VAPRESRSIVPFVLVGLTVALLIGVVVSNFAASTPDALLRAVIDSACEGEPNVECLAEQEGEPVLGIQPASTFDYEVTWFSGLVGVLLCFALGAGLVLPLRRTGGSPDRSFSRER